MNTYRVGVVGCGGIAQVHGGVLRELPGVELAACADIRPERAQAFAETFGGVPYPSLEEMLEKERLDCLHICTPHYLHTPMAKLAAERGVIVLTDSDGAGFVIRNHLKGILPKEQVKHAYIPDVAGKERRKARAGREGKLGVEGMKPAVLLEALRRCGATFLDGDGAQSRAEREPITKADLLELGLAGPGSAARRQALQKQLRLPAHLTANGLLEVLNLLYTREELEDEISRESL